MAEFKGFRCDGACDEVYPDSQKNEVIIRFVGPQFSGEVTKEYCSQDVKAEVAKYGPLSPLKTRHRATPRADATPATEGASGAPTAASAGAGSTA